MKYFGILLITILFAFSACSIDDANAPKYPNSVGKLSGKVVTNNNIPLNDVKITTSPAFKEVLTNNNGEFDIAAIPDGKYTVIATKAGYKTARIDTKIAAGYKTSVKITMNEGVDENNPPTKPHNPRPPDKSKISNKSFNLRWECSDPDGDKLSYTVYFGASNPPVKVADNRTENSFDVKNLKTGKTYYWKIVAKDEKGAETAGNIWSFTVNNENNPPNKPYNPNPANNAVLNVNEYTLTWKCDDPDGDELTYNVFINGNKVAEKLKKKSFTFENMKDNTRYSWLVVAVDTKGASTRSDLWVFNVKLAQNRPPLAPFNPFPLNLSIINQKDIEFTWQCSDPDGDKLTYDFYLAKNAEPLKLVGKNLALKRFPFNGLQDNSGYRWKVVAKDTKGASTASAVLFFATKFQSGNLYEKMFAYYPFNGDVRDAGPKHYDGINHFAAFVGTDRFNRKGRALYLGKWQEYVELPHPEAFALNGDFTIAYWVKPDFGQCIPAGTHIDVICKTDTKNNWWYSGFTTKLGPEFWINNKYIGYDFIKLKNQKWNHIALVFKRTGRSNQGTATLYLDGSQVGEKKVLPIPTNTNDKVRIGDRPGKSSFAGWVDDLYFFNRSLTSNEIQVLMNKK